MNPPTDRKKTPSWLLFVIGLALVFYTPFGFIFLFIDSTDLRIIYYPIAVLLLQTLGNESDLAKVETAFVPLTFTFFVIALLVRRRRKSLQEKRRYGWYLFLLTAVNMITIVVLLLIFSTCNQIVNPYNGYCGGFHYFGR